MSKSVGYRAEQEGSEGTMKDDIALRDYFAAMAMQGMMTRDPDDLAHEAGRGKPVVDYVAKASYAVAKAMLKEREGKPPQCILDDHFMCDSCDCWKKTREMCS